MSTYERTEKSKHHENEDVLRTEGKPNLAVNMNNITTDFIINIPDNEIIVPTDVSVDQTEAINITDIGIDKTLDKGIEKHNVKEIDKDDTKSPETNMFMTIRIYETYYGRQRPPTLPREDQIEQSLPPQYRDDYGGGHGGPPLAYEPGSRNSFVMLVFSIVFVMVFITSVCIGIVLSSDNLRFMFLRHHMMFFVIGIVLMVICNYAMYLSPCSRAPPCNFIMLGLAVVAFTILASNLSARFKTSLVLYAAIATTIVLFVCLMLACTSFDFTSWLLYVVAIATVFFAISTIIFVGAIITQHYPKPLHIAILVIGTIIQVVMLIIELQMILGGKSVELSENDYALGAYMMYTSILSLFMDILHLLGLTS